MDAKILLPLGGAIAGAGNGLFIHSMMPQEKKEKEKQSLFSNNRGKIFVATGAILGAIQGRAAYNDMFKRYGGYTGGRSSGGSSSLKKNEFSHIFNKAKTKSEAKKAYYDLAKKHHPDKGGATETAQKINVAWEDFKNSHAFSKLSSYQKIWTSSFFNEMEKIAQYNS